MTSRRLLEPASRVLLDAADLIEERVWWNGIKPREGRLCALLAIDRVAGFGCEKQAACDRLRDRVGTNILRWNDLSTASDVVATMRRAALEPGTISSVVR